MDNNNFALVRVTMLSTYASACIMFRLGALTASQAGIACIPWMFCTMLGKQGVLDSGRRVQTMFASVEMCLSMSTQATSMFRGTSGKTSFLLGIRV